MKKHFIFRAKVGMVVLIVFLLFLFSFSWNKNAKASPHSITDISYTITENKYPFSDSDNNGFCDDYCELDLPRLNKDYLSLSDGPKTVSANAHQYATAYGNSRKLFRDQYGKLITVFVGNDTFQPGGEYKIHMAYSNDNGDNWIDNTFGVEYSVPGSSFQSMHGDDNTITAEKGTGLKVFDFFPETSVGSGLYQVRVCVPMMGQAFRSPSTSKVFKAVRFYLKQEGDPPGNMRAKLYATTGDPAIPTGDPLAISEDLNVEILGTSYELIQFIFPSPYTLSPDTWYAVVFEYGGGGAGGPQDINTTYLGRAEFFSSTHPGHAVTYFSCVDPGWIAEAPLDAVFYVLEEVDNAIMFSWTDDAQVKFSQITFGRDINNNIIGYSTSDILSITPPLGKDPERVSLWLLHNGEVGAVWGETSLTGSQQSAIEFARIVFGDPPTYKNAAGTANQVDQLHIYGGRFPKLWSTIVEHPTNNAIWVFYGTSYYEALQLYKIKATWSDPNWSWGSSTAMGAVTVTGLTANVDTINGRVLYAYTTGVGGSYTVHLRSIDSSDSETETTFFTTYNYWQQTLAVDGSTYYIFYIKKSTFEASQAILYAKYTGTWSVDNVLYDTQPDDYYPSAKFDSSDNRIELIWTQGTSPYKVIYDYIDVTLGYSINLTGQLKYTNGSAVADTQIKVAIKYQMSQYEITDTTDSQGFFYITIGNLPEPMFEPLPDDFDIEFSVLGVVYECHYDTTTETCS